MKIRHIKPDGWIDTAETGVIQPSHVAGLVHEVELEEGDLMQGTQGPKGDDGEPGPQGPAGPRDAAMVAYFARATAPAGWLIADGAVVSRAEYPALFSAVGVMFGAGDGVSTFKLPDLRGEFLRGLDGGRGVDAGRVIGSAQGDEFRSHSHAAGGVAANSGTGGKIMGAGSAYSTSSVGGVETRPRNVALLPCIATGV